MLRRRMKAPPPGPVEEAARRRRRLWTTVAAASLVAILLIVALFTLIWLRSFPPLDVRWVRMPEAVAVARVDWSGEGAPLARVPLEALHASKFSDTVDMETFWSSVNFMVHPSATLWIVSSESADGARPASDTSSGNRDGEFAWVGALSLKRRQAFIERQVNRLLGRVGAGALPGRDESGGETSAGGGKSGLVGGVRRGALVVATAGERAARVLDTLSIASRTGAKSSPSPESMDAAWVNMPEGVPLAFVVRDPSRWAAPTLRTLVEKEWRDLFDALWPESPEVFGDAPWLVGSGSLTGADTLQLSLSWDRATGDAAPSQSSAINQLILDINKAFDGSAGYELKADILLDGAPDSTGITLRLTHWSRLIGTARSAR